MYSVWMEILETDLIAATQVVATIDEAAAWAAEQVKVFGDAGTLRIEVKKLSDKEDA